MGLFRKNKWGRGLRVDGKEACKIMQATGRVHNMKTYPPNPGNPDLVGVPMSLKADI